MSGHRLRELIKDFTDAKSDLDNCVGIEALFLHERMDELAKALVELKPSAYMREKHKSVFDEVETWL